mmetsp:Transcript_25056/g.54263  ORF Transcript_25056/g.54263 Transcript_25056/m.54263 type:complete len:265 (+) Transcript_25056:113-907(+)
MSRDAPSSDTMSSGAASNTDPTAAPSSSKKMDNLINDALRIVTEFATEPAMYLYFQHCYGIVLLSSYEASFLFSAQGGTGILLRRDKEHHRWSPPCAIGLVGGGVGIQAGVSKKDVIMFLTEKSMVKALTGEFQLRIGAQIGMTLGREGEEDDFYAHFSNRGVASISSFAHTKGASFGLSFEGGLIVPRLNVNREYYTDTVSPRTILYGDVAVPTDGADAGGKLEELYAALDEAMVKPKPKPVAGTVEERQQQQHRRATINKIE